MPYMASFSIQTIPIDDQSIPPILKTIYDPPKVLYVQGALPQDRLYIAIVGSRTHSSYGATVTDSIIASLAPHNVVIVSGLAYGIDTLAHKAALTYNIPTIAILGSGIDAASLSPGRNRSLAHAIVQSGGALVSEYAIGTKAAKWTFPKRNRIIAGISTAIVVVEARAKSGALITAQYGIDHGRDVFAVPHPITSPTAAGTNKLLQQGAHILTEPHDIHRLLGLQQPKTQHRKPYIPQSPTEETILSLLSTTPIHIDILAQQMTLSTAELTQQLVHLELHNTVQRLPGMRYQRTY